MKILKRSCSAASALIALLCVVGCTGGSAPDRPNGGLGVSRYVQAFSDPDNGCQYFSTMDGGLYPRLNKDGSQFGCK